MPPARPLLLFFALALAFVFTPETAAWLRPQPQPQHCTRRRPVVTTTTRTTMATGAAAAAGDDDRDGNVPVIHEPATLNPRAEDYSILAAKVLGWCWCLIRAAFCVYSR